MGNNNGYYGQGTGSYSMDVQPVDNGADFNQLMSLTGIALLVLACIILYIILVLIPFVQRLRYYRIELGRATDEKKPRWRKRIIRLYFTLIPFVGPIMDFIRYEEYKKFFKIFRRRKRRRRRKHRSSSHHSSHYHHDGHHHSHHHHDEHHHHHHDEHGEGKTEKHGE